MPRATVRAAQVGGFVHLRGRGGRRRSVTGRCLSPGCEDAVGPGLRFCPAHQRILGDVRAALAGAESVDPRERYKEGGDRLFAAEPPGAAPS